MEYFLLLVGFLLLIKGADMFVDGSSSFAKILKIPSMVIGLTIVAFGTSAPELAVSLTSSIKGENDIAIANVLGSNIFNILVVLGVTALLRPIKIKKSILLQEFPFLIFSTFVLVFISFDIFLKDGAINILSRSDGLILLSFFVIFLYSLIKNSLFTKEIREEEESIKVMPLWKTILFSVIGLAGIVLGGDLVVDNASKIALSLGLSQIFIGLTIVAIGTSLPELVTSIIAIKKGHDDIALGNVVGSNIFNCLFILGLSVTVAPIQLFSPVFVDIIVVLFVTILVFIFSINKKIGRVEGALFLVCFIIYMAYVFVRTIHPSLLKFDTLFGYLPLAF